MPTTPEEKVFQDVQLHVDFTQASTRSNISTYDPTAAEPENISTAFGKLSKWYEALVPTGGSDGQFLGWNSDGTAKWVNNPNADTKVTQQSTSSQKYRPILFGYTEATDPSGLTSTVTNKAFVTSKFYVKPSTGQMFIDGLLQISNSSYGPLTIKRTTTANAGIRFENSNGFLGSLGIGTVDGVFKRYLSDNSTYYTILDTGNTSVTTTGSGNAITSLSFSNGVFTADKGSTFLTQHPTITLSADTTSTPPQLSHGGTFTAITSVTREGNGHVTKINTATYTLPNDTSMTQTNTTGSADYRVLLSGNANDTTETTTGRKSTNLKFNPSTGVLSASSGVTTKTITRSALKGMLTGSGTAAQDKGSGVSPRYFPAKWTFNTGLTAANGDVFIIKLPTAGHSYGVFLSIDNGANYYPISVNGTSRLTTHYGNGYSIAVMFKSDGSTADVFPLAGGDSRSTVTGGCWQVLNYYDSGNTNTKVNVTLGTTTKAYLLGTSTTPTSSAQAVTSIADTGVYLGTTAGSLYATTFYGALSGNATSATTASKLGSSTVGSTRKPIYLNSGTATEANYMVSHFGNAGKSNMNDVGKMFASVGMTNLSDPGNTVDNPMNGTTKSTSWHLYWDACYSDDPSGSNGWVAQIANKAGSAQWWVRSRQGGTITNGTEWSAGWEHLTITSQAGAGSATNPVYVDSNGHTQACTYSLNKSVPSNALFTDANVTQTPADSTYTNYRPLLIGNSSGTSAGFTPTLTTAGVYATAGIYCQPSSGYVYASDFMTNTYPSGTGSSLSQYGLYLKSYFKCADSSQTVLQYAGYGVRTYSGKITSSDGIAMAVGCGGLTVLGSGESAHNLISLISDDQKISGNTTLNVGGTLNTTFVGNSEVAIVSSDNSIYLITNCQTIANRKPVCLDTNSYFYPGTNKTGSIGTSSYMWNSVYAATIYENGTSLASKYAAIGHTHDSLYGVQSSSAVPVTTLVNGQLKVFYNVNNGLSGNMPATNNANAIIQINKHGGDYDSQLGFSSNGNIYYRSCNGTVLSSSVPWRRIYDTSNPPTASEVGALASTTKYAASSSVGGAATKVATTVTNGTTSTVRYGIAFVADPDTSNEQAVLKNYDFRFNLLNGTDATGNTGNAEIVLGNNKSSGTAGNKKGVLTLYSTGSYYGGLNTGTLTANRTYTLPDAGGTIALTTNTGVGSSWWNDRDNAVIRITTADSSYRPLWSLLTSTTGSWAVGNHNNDNLVFNFISKATYDTGTNPASNAYKQVKFTNTGGITTTGGISALSYTLSGKANGYYGYDQATKKYCMIGDSGSNLWIGTFMSTEYHHKGSTFISAGWTGTLPTAASSSLTGNTTIKISVPVYTVDANGNGSWNQTAYDALHSGNYTSYALATTTKYAGSSSVGGAAISADVTVTDVPSTSTTTSDSWYRSYGLLFAQNPNTTQANTLRKSHNLRFYHSPNGTADTVGVGELIVGNNTASGTAGNMQGRLILYSSSSSYISMVPTATSSSVILTLPAVTGTVPSFTATPTSGQVVITDGTGGGIKSSGSTIVTTPSSKVNTNWGTTSDRTTIVTKGWMSYWDGSYNGSASNLTYCNKGAFGTIITKNTGDYVPSHGDLNGTIGSNSPAADVKTFFMTSSVPSGCSSIGYNTSGNEYTLIFGKGVNTNGYGAVLRFGYNSSYPEMLRIQNGSWKSTDWEKISAGYADSAGKVLYNTDTNSSDTISIVTADIPANTNHMTVIFKVIGSAAGTGKVYVASTIPYIRGVYLGGVLHVSTVSDDSGSVKLSLVPFTIQLTTSSTNTSVSLIHGTPVKITGGSTPSDRSGFDIKIVKIIGGA